VPDITSRQHPLVHAFKDAARGDDTMRALLDGWHLVHDAVDAGITLTAVAITGTPSSPRDTALVDRLARQTDVFAVTPSVMDAMSPVRTPSGIVALAIRHPSPLPRLFEPRPALIVLADDIQDPGNVGAIVRSVEAGGGTGVLFTGASADPWGWKALRASMGSTFRLPVASVRDATAAIDAVRRAGLAVIATVPRAGVSPHEVDLRRSCALLVGAEGAGLGDELVRQADEALTIPMRAPVESLNVAVAAALLIYEARRQREA
jgi:TrmH family RNA methyltransferase